MKQLLTAGLLLAMIPAAQAGMKSICTHGNESRVIEVVYSSDGPLPCEVHYTKAEGTQVLWSAQNAMGYCEQKAEEFTEKQRAWGWECETTRDAVATEQSAEPVAASAEAAEAAPAAEEGAMEQPADAEMATETPAASEAQPASDNAADSTQASSQ